MTQPARHSAAAHLVVVLGAESTGKSDLCAALAQALPAHGIGATVVAEYLREWCDAAGRTPSPVEQIDIAHAQCQRIARAMAEAQAMAQAQVQANAGTARTGQPQVVLADTSAWMTATYSQVIFEDASLWPLALSAHRAAPPTLTLVTGNDLPWQPDGIQRDGAHMRTPVLRVLRTALDAADVPYSNVYGQGLQRPALALQALLQSLQRGAMNPPAHPAADAIDLIAAYPDKKGAAAPFDSNSHDLPTRWSAWCAHCGDSDPACERRLFTRLA